MFLFETHLWGGDEINFVLNNKYDQISSFYIKIVISKWFVLYFSNYLHDKDSIFSFNLLATKGFNRSTKWRAMKTELWKKKKCKEFCQFKLILPIKIYDIPDLKMFDLVNKKLWKKRRKKNSKTPSFFELE